MIGYDYFFLYYNFYFFIDSGFLVIDVPNPANITLVTQENKLKKKKLIQIPKLFFYVKSIHLRGSCRKVKKAVRRRMHALGRRRWRK